MTNRMSAFIQTALFGVILRQHKRPRAVTYGKYTPARGRFVSLSDAQISRFYRSIWIGGVVLPFVLVLFISVGTAMSRIKFKQHESCFAEWIKRRTRTRAVTAGLNKTRNVLIWVFERWNLLESECRMDNLFVRQCLRRDESGRLARNVRLAESQRNNGSKIAV